MAYGNTCTITGNATADPELRFTANGTAVCDLGVAWNRQYERGGETVKETSFFDVTCWAELAENVAESVRKGQRVTVHGRMEQNTWDAPDGERRSKIRVVADDVALSLRWSGASPLHAERRERRERPDAGAPPKAPRAAAPPRRAQRPSYGDEEPF